MSTHQIEAFRRQERGVPYPRRNHMSTPMVATRTLGLYIWPTLRAITIAALLGNALLFLFDVFSSGPDDINVTHVIISLVVAGIAAIRVRWVPVLGALLCVLQLVERCMFLCRILTQLA